MLVIIYPGKSYPSLRDELSIVVTNFSFSNKGARLLRFDEATIKKIKN